MSKKIRIIIAISIIIIIGILGFLFFYKNSGGKTGFDLAKDALPFGKGAQNDLGFTQTPTKDEGGFFSFNKDGIETPKLFQIHKESIAGAYPFIKKITSKTEVGDTPNENSEPVVEKKEEVVFIRYMERGLGHIFETNISTMKENRISNITRLKIYESVWGNDGKNVVIRYLDDVNNETIRSFLIKLSENTLTEEIPGEVVDISIEPKEEGLFLPENIKNITTSTDSKKVFYIIDTGDSAIGTIYNMESGNSTQILRSALTEWLIQWPNDNIITLTTKPSSNIPGFLYFLDTDTENMTKILGNINGLTTLVSPNGKKVLYSESVGGVITLNVYDIEKQSTEKLPLTTLPEKCIWGVNSITTIYCAIPTTISINSYPDQWYKGLISFSDEVWKINTETYTTEFIISPTDEIREDMDIINLSIDPNSEYLFFSNKKDLSLWGIKL